MPTPPPYIPTPHLIASSGLTTDELVSQYQDFSNSIRYIPTAPELVFERLVANLSDCIHVSVDRQRQGNSSALATSLVASGKLTVEDTKVTETGPVADISKAVAVKTFVKNNPVIGTFHTNEARSSLGVCHNNSKVVTFAHAYAMVPGLLVGLNLVDIDHHKGARVTAFTSLIQRDRFEIHLDSWIDTTLHNAGCTWLELEADDMDFQYGCYHTIEDHPETAPQKYNTRKITFKRAYTAPPHVVVWLTMVALGPGSAWRIKSFATDVTAAGFTIHIITWADSTLWKAAASWIAYPRDRQGVASGNFSTLDLHSWAQPQSYNSAYQAFGNGVFEKPPRVFVALNALDISRSHEMRLVVTANNISAAGMTWHLNSWMDTILYSAGASYIAFS